MTTDYVLRALAEQWFEDVEPGPWKPAHRPGEPIVLDNANGDSLFVDALDAAALINHLESEYRQGTGTRTERIGALLAADPEAFDWITAMAAQKVLRVVEDRVNSVRGDGHNEPGDPALDWVLAVIHAEERKAIGADGTTEPDEDPS